MTLDEVLLYVIVCGIVAAVIGAGVGYLLRKRIAEARIGSAEEKANQIAADAQKMLDSASREAETLKKETLVQTCRSMNSVWYRRKAIWTGEVATWNRENPSWTKKKIR